MNGGKSRHSLIEQSVSVAASAGMIGTGLGLALYPNYWPLFTTVSATTATVAVITSARIRQRKQPLDGRNEVSSQELAAHLSRKQHCYQNLQHPGREPRLKLGSVPLTSEHETLHFFIVGKSGAGKSQAIFQLLTLLRHRPDFRVVVLDRGGEILSHFYQPSDVIFNPLDRRSINWCHSHEMKFIPAEEIAASFLPIPDVGDNRIWYEYAQMLLSAFWERTYTNSEVNQILNARLQDIQYLVQGHKAIRCFDEPRLAANVLFTLAPTTKSYEYLLDTEPVFSFFQHGSSDDPRWLFLPLLEKQTETLKPITSAAIDLVIRGVLSRNPYPTMKTAIVIDELGALQKLPSLERFVSEGRKYGGVAILGAQSEAQITRNYSYESTRILLQNTGTKLILNCPDPETSELMAKVIGKQRFWEEKVGENRDMQGGGRIEARNWDLREQYVIQPSQIQMLPNLEGYLLTGDDNPVARIQLPFHHASNQTSAFVPRNP